MAASADAKSAIFRARNDDLASRSSPCCYGPNRGMVAKEGLPIDRRLRHPRYGWFWSSDPEMMMSRSAARPIATALTSLWCEKVPGGYGPTQLPM